jgi:hypothetical protein
MSSSLAVAGVAAWRGRVEGSTSWRPVNAISHIVWGPSAGSQRGFSLRYTGFGLLLNGAACAFWSALYEYRRRPMKDPLSMMSAVLGAIGIAALAYVTDYHIVPRRFTPGFELSLSRRSFSWLYGALAAGMLIPACAAGRGPSALTRRLRHGHQPDFHHENRRAAAEVHSGNH